MEYILPSLKVGLIAILLLPGFIFVQIIERHLLREKKPQFEKSLEIFLSSILIWIIFAIFPYTIPCTNLQNDLFAAILNSLKADEYSIKKMLTDYKSLPYDFAIYFIAICIWAFLLGNVWGIFRKWQKTNMIISFITGRNWYPNVSYEFYNDNLDKPIEFTINDKRYLGILHRAPDTTDDNYIIIRDLYEIKKKLNTANEEWEFEALSSIKQMVIKISEIKEMKSYTDKLLKDSNKN